MTTQNERNKEYYEKTKGFVVSIRLSGSTMEKFDQLTAQTNKGKSELIRAILEGATIKVPNPKVTDDVLRELSAIGNNLNQLAHANNIAKETGLQLSGLGLKIQEVRNELALIKERL
jgi:predicted DNA-binding protein